MTEENFYTSGGTLGRSAPSYVTRRADSELLNHLLSGEFCYVLTSRQMGKSSLMVRTAAALRAQGTNVAVLDLTRVGQNVSIEQWYGGLLTRLGSDLNLEDELDDYWLSDRASRLGPMQRFMSAVREIVFPATTGKLVVFIDEIDAVRSLPFSSDEFFAGIRECYNSRVGEPEFNRITFCLLGVAQPSDLISNVHITPFNIGNRVELTDFTEDEAEPLLEGLRGRAAVFGGGRALLHRILHWTGGHPYLTQKLCESVSQLEKGLTVADVDAVCQDLFLSTRSREQQDNLIFVRDRVLASKEDRAAILDLYDRVHRGGTVRDDDSNATIDPLRLSGLLVVSGGFLKVRNRIYSTVFDHKWVIANMPDAELRRQKAAYHRGVVKTIIIGVPVGLAILALCFFALLQTKKMEHSYYLATTATAQQAFNAGDIGAGTGILHKWMSEGGGSGKAYSDGDASGHSEGILQHIEHSMDGHERLETSFAIRLLSAEAEGADDCVLQHQDSLTKMNDCVHGGQPVNGALSSCAAATAVATAMYNDGNKSTPFVAAAGTDSSVQIWNASTGEPLHRLQLKADGGSIRLDRVVDTPLDACPPKDNDGKKSDHKGEDLPGIMAISFSPDGSKLAIATGTWRHPVSPGYVLVWDLKKPPASHNVSVLAADGISDLGTETNPDRSFSRPTDSVSWTKMPDGRLYLGASSDDATARLWEYGKDATAPRPLPLIEPQKLCFAGGDVVGGIGANVITFSDPREHLMALGYGDGHLVLYDLLDPNDPPLYAGIVHVSGIMSMVFLEQPDVEHHTDHLRLVVGTRDGDMLILDPHALPRTNQAASCSPVRGSAAVQEQADDSSYAAFKASLVANQGVLQGLAVTYKKSENGDITNAWLLTSGSNNTVGLWTVSPYFHLQQTFTGATEGVHAAAFCPGDDCIISASSDGRVRLWRYPYQNPKEHSHMMPNELGLHFPGQMLGVVFPFDKKQKLITAVGETLRGQTDDRGTVAVWDPPAGKQLDFSGKQPQELTGYRGLHLLGFDVSPDHRFVVATSRSRNLDLLDLATNTDRPLSPAVYVTLNPKIRVRCLDAEGKHIIDPCAQNQRDYLIIGVADRNDVGQDAGQHVGVKKHLQAKGLCMWHIRATGSGFDVLPGINPCTTDPSSLSGPTSDFVRLVRDAGMFDISSGGSYIVTSHDSDKGSTTVALWKSSDLLDEKPHSSPYKFQDFDSHFVDMSFSPTSSPTKRPEFIVATTVDSRMYYWPANPERTSPPVEKQLPARGQALAFSPPLRDSNSVLAVGLQDGRILLWDWGSSSRDWNQLMEVRKHHGGILGLAFSPQGDALASAGNDGLVTLLRAPKTPESSWHVF